MEQTNDIKLTIYYDVIINFTMEIKLIRQMDNIITDSNGLINIVHELAKRDNQIKGLIDEMAKRDEQIETLFDEMAKRDEQIKNLIKYNQNNCSILFGHWISNKFHVEFVPTNIEKLFVNSHYSSDCSMYVERYIGYDVKIPKINCNGYVFDGFEFSQLLQLKIIFFDAQPKKIVNNTLEEFQINYNGKNCIDISGTPNLKKIVFIVMPYCANNITWHDNMIKTLNTHPNIKNIDIIIRYESTINNTFNGYRTEFNNKKFMDLN
jgi:hypothetical protein